MCDEINLTGYFLQESMIKFSDKFSVLDGIEMWHVKPLSHTFSKEHKMLLTEASKSNNICEIKIGVNVYKGMVIFFDNNSNYFYIVKEHYVDKYKY